MTTAPFSDEWAALVVQQLVERGVEFSDPLTKGEIAALGAAIGVQVPPEMAALLEAAVPVSAGWARWSEGPDAVARHARAWIDHAFAFDIEHNDYWHSLFGEKPRRTRVAIEQALVVVHSAPPLFPLYSHRFLVSAPANQRRAVLSVWQAGDSTFYGNDLADYLHREFSIDRPEWAADEAPTVPVWEDLFDL